MSEVQVRPNWWGIDGRVISKIRRDNILQRKPDNQPKTTINDEQKD